jgi:O-succinylbenzoic acid--CoA ligase
MTSVEDFIREWRSPSERVLLHTSGSTGTPKTFWAEKSRMRASARMTCDFLGLHSGDNALLCLSTDYIAGKMMVVRALERGLNLLCVEPSNRPLEALQEQYPVLPAIHLAAMVPSQVFCSIDHPLLRQIQHIIIGGGAVSPELEQTLRSFPNAVWSSYGMTETLSHIALRRVSGAEAEEWYTPLPGVSVSLNSDGCLCIDAPALSPEPLITNDIAQLSPSGSFRILGRRDNVIQSGGIKLQIEVLEAELRPLLDSNDGKPLFCVTSRPSAKFGEEAVLLVVPELLPLASEIHHSYIKAVIPVTDIPLTATGKIDRARAKSLAATECGGL